jgi:hypothetical protein
MSTDKAFDEALDNLIPKALDCVITLNRSHAELRIATAADLEPLREVVPKHDFAEDIECWTFITLDWHPPERPRQILIALFGYNVDRHQAWNTSQIMRYDENTGCVRTKSGSTYRMVGESSAKPELLRVCAWVHSARIGEHLGVMHIFY